MARSCAFSEAVLVTVDIAELRRRARAALPPDVYAYYATGAGREVTLRAATKAWRHVQFLPHVLRDVSDVDTSLRLPGLAGGPLRTPIAVAPTAFHSLAHPDGELATAAGAAQAGALFVLSTRSSRKIEDVASVVAAAGGTWWFQVYVLRDRQLTASLARRAAAAGAQALVLTGDTPRVGRRGRARGEAIITDADFRVNVGPLADDRLAEPAGDVTMSDIHWLADLSGLPVVVKGVLRGDDALACAAAGAAGVIVSNHGGRQLDRAVPTAAALAGVSAAADDVPGGLDVFVDGGVRSAEDVLAALALGARLAFLGRPILWALATGGAPSVRALLEDLTADLSYVLALAGLTSPGQARDIGAVAPSTLARAPHRHNVEA